MAKHQNLGTAGPGDLESTVKPAWFMPEELVRRPISELIPYARNARTHSPEQIRQLRASLREFGFVNPVLIDSAGNIIAGHGRVLAAEAEGMDEVPCVLVEHLSDAQRRAYILADNRLAEMSGWDLDMVALELEDLQLEGIDLSITGFSEADLEMEDPNAEPEAAQDDDDNGEPDESAPPRTEDGDVWKLGDHILLCGNCSEKPLLEQFLRGGGNLKIDLLLTDPPYGVEYVGKTGDAMTIENDGTDRDALLKLLSGAFTAVQDHLREGAAYYIWCASRTWDVFVQAVESLGWQVREQLIWNKDTFVMGRQDYQWKHEPCLYGWKPGAAHKWCSDRSQTTVIDCPRPKASREHPTMKPIPLFDRLIRNSTEVGDVVYDPFGGSGTTLLACEQAGRRCITVEIAPKYCDVILRRWEALTGRTAERVMNLK